MRLPKTKTWSIAARLFVSAAVLSTAILLVAGLLLSALYGSMAESGFDERLGVYLRALVADIAATSPGSSDESRSDFGQLGEPLFELALSGWYWQITRLDANTPDIRSSRSLFAARLRKLADEGVAAGVGGARKGYVKGPDDRRLRMVERMIDIGDQGIYLVQVAATTETIDSEIASFELDLVLTFTVLAAALVGSAALQLRYGLNPLWRLRDGVAAIRRGENEKIEGDFPQDIAPLAAELNLLVEANREVVERARTQVGNLAHALKTPLSVIFNEATMEATPLAEKMKEQAMIMRDQVTYHLDRARIAVGAKALGNITDVAPVVAALLRTFEKIYQDRRLVFTASVAENIKFLGERQDLEEMIGNLVDNAGKWARTSVSVSVVTLPGQGQAGLNLLRVTIDDDGSGLAPDLRRAALRRGRRLDETKPGSGLGLSIVADQATLYGGALRLDSSSSGGLCAVLDLPAA
ncbi:MAG: ATP-binding protein [Beijerinckiaceae bacterium]